MNLAVVLVIAAVIALSLILRIAVKQTLQTKSSANLAGIPGISVSCGFTSVALNAVDSPASFTAVYSTPRNFAASHRKM